MKGSGFATFKSISAMLPDCKIRVLDKKRSGYNLTGESMASILVNPNKLLR